MTTDLASVQRYQQLLAAIAVAARRVGRDSADVKLVGAAKTVPVARLRPVVAAGLSIVGENYLQEAKAKIAALDLPVSWHFIGHLQSNKAAAAVKLFDLIHSVDRLSLAQALARAASRLGKVQDILLEVNIAGEASKSGVAPAALEDLLRACAALPHLRVRGLMTMPPWSPDPEAVRPYFRQLRAAREQLQALNLPGVELVELSMGMSDDFVVAIEEGATLVRIGTALFGPRTH
ncbi:MAG: YggS family pyridoxal phosphate-dependent enzyme [Desulfobacca sp.]|uniref:YggS family pyridoxal phosphate-dependent enzyme n=1 Tax=Desulfobacca sp. TaxID=2067990 RepID=UPI00404A377B